MNAISQTSAGRLSPKSRQKNPNHTKGAQLRFCSATVTSERSPLLINIGHWQASLHTQATTYPDRPSAMHRRTTDRLTRLLASVSARPEDRQSMGSAPPPHQSLGSTAMAMGKCVVLPPPPAIRKDNPIAHHDRRRSSVSFRPRATGEREFSSNPDAVNLRGARGNCTWVIAPNMPISPYRW